MRIVIPLILALAACSPQPQGPDDEPATAQSPDSEPTAATAEPPEPVANAVGAADLPGYYRLAGVDGEAIDLPHGVAVEISSDRIDVESACVRMAWRYSLDEGRLDTEEIPVETCERELFPQEAAIKAALDSATTVSRDASNATLIGDGTRSIALYTQ